MPMSQDVEVEFTVGFVQITHITAHLKLSAENIEQEIFHAAHFHHRFSHFLSRKRFINEKSLHP